MGNLITDLGAGFTGVIGNVGTVSETIITNPLLLLAFVPGFIGLVVGVVKKISHR